MRHGTENGRYIARQTEYRKRRKRRVKVFCLLLMIILGMYALRIRELGSRLADVQTSLKRMEVLQQEAGGKESDSETDAEEPKGQSETDYIGRMIPVSVEKPIKRTRKEAVQRLNELGQENPVIAKISQNSDQYPEDMLTALANNPEMADFAAGYLDSSGTATGGLTDAEKKQDFPLFLQWDSRWGYCSYGKGSNIGLSGCGPTCMSMVLYYLTGNEALTPDKVADYAMKNGYYVEGTGTAWALMKDVPGLYGIKVTEPDMSESGWREALRRGQLLICAMSAGDFTAGGHFIVVYGYDKDGFMVNDSNCVARSRRRWSFEEIRGQVKMVWAYELREEGQPLEERQAVTFVDFAG